MVEVKKPYFPYSLILRVFRKMRGAERVAMVDPFFKNIMAYPAPYEVSDATYAHELCHLEQAEREGRFKFAAKYIWYLIRYGYDANPYEVEAREAAVQG